MAAKHQKIIFFFKKSVSSLWYFKKNCALLVFNWQKYVPKKKLFYLSYYFSLSHTHTHTHKTKTKPQKKDNIIPFADVS